jgi:hypothetical protein
MRATIGTPRLGTATYMSSEQARASRTIGCWSKNQWRRRSSAARRATENFFDELKGRIP